MFITRFGFNLIQTVSGEVSLSWYDSPVSRSHSEESDSVRLGVTQPKLHIVSRRAMQFETGQLEEEDRTPFYRSELSRLKHLLKVDLHYLLFYNNKNNDFLFFQIVK